MKLLDTTVLVDIDRGDIDEKVRKLDDEGKHAVSIVTATELYLGIEKQYNQDTEEYAEAVEKLERLLSRFEIIEIDRRIAIVSAHIISNLQEKGEPLNDLHDVYIGATAQTEQLEVLTPIVSHFERMEGVRVRDWTEW